MLALTRQNILWFLLDNGIIASTSDLLTCPFLVVESSRKNRNFAVLGGREDNHDWIVKQSKKQSGGDMLNEQRFYQVAKDIPELAHLIPKHMVSDGAYRAIVLAYYGDKDTYMSAMLRRGLKFDSSFFGYAQTLGAVVADYQYHLGLHFKHTTSIRGLRKVKPTAFQYLKRVPNFSHDQSVGQAKVLQIVRKHDIFARRLDEAIKLWKPGAIIHTDLKLENILIGGKDKSLKVIDWELWGIGDGAWDLAGVINSFFRVWILCLDSSTNVQEQFAVIKPYFQAFWESYAAKARLSASILMAQLYKSILYSGLRLMQSAYEAENQSATLRPPTLLMLQLSQNILSQPEDFIEYFSPDHD